MKSFKKNQIVIYTFALMLVAAGYLNYTSKVNKDSLETANQETYVSENETSDIGDAKLVNSNDVVDVNDKTNENVEENITDTKAQNTTENIEESKSENVVQTASNSTSNSENVVQTASNSTSNSDDYFVKSKLERETMYSQMLESYEKILNSSNSLETQKQSASQEITKINDTKNSIMICENLIKTKGFSNNVVFVNGKSVSVIIGTNDLKQEQTAQIQNIISRELNCEIQNIHISTK